MRITNLLVLCLLGLAAAARRPQPRSLQRRGGGALGTPTVGFCDSSLLRSFNLYGRQVAHATALSVCPNVHLSCCTSADQVAIYDNWVVDNEGTSLEAKFANYTKSIETFFEQAEEATSIAASVLTTMDKMKNNECKLMARRIVSYQLHDIKRALLEGFEGSYDFLVESAKGLYCSLCDANSHVFFNSGSRQVVISEQFCRSIVANTLTSLMYLRVHLPKYINLLSTFMGSCNAKGRFIKPTIPSGVIQTVDVTNEKVLTSCFKGRNTATWLSSCQSVCQKWQPGQVSPFFAPDLNHIDASLKFIARNIANFTANPVNQTTASNSTSVPGAQGTPTNPSSSQNPQTTPQTNGRVLSEKVSKSTKRLRKERGLQLAGVTNSLSGIIQPTPQPTTMPSSFPNYDPRLFDQFGQPVDFLNFTNNATNHTSLLYLISKESKKPTPRSGLPVNLTSNIIYQSQNTSNVTSLSEWTAVVNTQGADFFFASQYSIITMEAIEGLYDLGDTPATQPAGGIAPVQARKLKQKRPRKLASASVLAIAATVMLTLFNL